MVGNVFAVVSFCPAKPTHSLSGMKSSSFMGREAYPVKMNLKSGEKIFQKINREITMATYTIIYTIPKERPSV